MYQSSPHQNSRAVGQFYYLARRRRRACTCKLKLLSLLGTARVPVWPFVVTVTRTGSMTSNGGMRGEVYCGCCIARRRVEFEAELWYLEFKDR